ncbi:unnamed protein product [Rotaria socialis]|uniref:F-box domain-containing protein n=1 Tax=Rotaria socialis TaxID=392032 RepID=A0A818YG22_9BILA|nr:unnamed protein product [Rotaria socialis]CAF3391834.1 unnamed protein product [Rotaria socialis]CAF3749608.1 unnamed protein product [Rotaria socialis]CAF4317001.1 unnamed protein product [Rotaria socialis]CAF4449708.1 unnamed protein product [Rotaria socialis]
MKSRAEHLPIELWLSIFSYIEVHELFQAFYNLNNYFDKLFTSKHLLLYVQIESATRNNVRWCKSILDRLIRIQSSSKHASHDLTQFLQSYSTKLIQLKSLIIQVCLENIPSICSALEQLPSLEYISLTCIPTQKLLETILTTSTLRTCRFKFWRPIATINYHSCTANSNVEILSVKMLDDPNHSIIYLLLSHMPKLKHLEIEKNNSVLLFNQNLFVLEHLKVLKLIWNRHQYKSDYFENCRRIIANLRSLHLSIHYIQFNESFDHILIGFLCTLIKKIKKIKIFILCYQLMALIDIDLEKKFNNYCQKLAFEFSSLSDTSFQITWSEEETSKHTIQIIF